VKPHPDLLLGAESAWQPSASKEARMNQRAQELQLGGFGEITASLASLGL
jgi:hypothetical protein